MTATHSPTEASLSPVLRPLAWRLPIVMAERGIRTTAELFRRLEPYGLDITVQQLTRIVSQMPVRLNTQVLAVLTDALECSTDDLLRREGDRAAAAKGRVRATSLAKLPTQSARREPTPAPAPTPTLVKLPVAAAVTPVAAPIAAPVASRTPAHVLGPNVSSLVDIVIDAEDPTDG